MYSACVYALYDPRDWTARYIGKTEWTAERRLEAHYYGARRDPYLHNRKNKWLVELDSLGLEAVTRVIESGPDWTGAHAYEREADWIAKYRDYYASIGRPEHLLNAASRGVPCRTNVSNWTDEQREAWSILMRDAFQRNPRQPLTDQQRANMREGHRRALAKDPMRNIRAQAKSAETIARRVAEGGISPGFHGRHSEETKERLRQVGQDPEYYARWKAAYDLTHTAEMHERAKATYIETCDKRRGYKLPPSDWHRPCAACGKDLSDTAARWHTRSCPECVGPFRSLLRRELVESKSEYEARVLKEWNQ